MIGMFLELKTIWKRLPGETLHNVPNKSPSTEMTGLKGLEIHLKDRRRRVGILFSKHQETKIWNFLVLIGPGNNELGFSIVDVDVENEFPNTHLTGGITAKCTDRPLRLRDIINYIDVRLKKIGPSFVENIARAVLFGWGEFLKEMRSEIIKAIPLVPFSKSDRSEILHRLMSTILTIVTVGGFLSKDSFYVKLIF
jgi:hypothetical protein